MAERPTASVASSGGGVGYSLHQLSELAIDMEIMHERFGHGRIIDLETDETGDKIIVLFDNVAQRKLMLKYARFRIMK